MSKRLLAASPIIRIAAVERKSPAGVFRFYKIDESRKFAHLTEDKKYPNRETRFLGCVAWAAK